jgi:hypothetical protein
MTEPIAKAPGRISDDASNDEAQRTFDRLLRQYFWGEYPESRSHTASEQVVSKAAGVSVE